MVDDIKNIINEYKNYIIKNKFLKNYSDLSILLSIAQMDAFCFDEQLNDYFIKSCKDLKNKIENNKGFYTISMIGGLGQYLFTINEFSKKTGTMIHFNESLHSYYSNYVKNIINYKCKNKKSSFNDYDVISGASGVLYYLLDNIELIQDKDVINDLISYLSNVSFYHETTYGQILLNFGLAHGMVGVLVSLCKAYNKGYIIENQINKINELFERYEKFQKKKDNITFFPSIITFDEFRKNEFMIEKENRAYTWCYGNTTILYSLIKSYYYIGNINKAKKYMDLLNENFNYNVSDYKLSTSIICHGYSSVINLINSSMKNKYLENKNNIKDYFLKKIINDINESDLYNYINNNFKNDISFLQGFVGVIMTLNTFIDDKNSFDKLLLID